ncbi:hypothetical protein [Paraburkholderia sp. 32]|uniref:hypothetical protein n=1 Tax=Paraburkholderia sp. 32 TaxID=2991057 RepID=UPI003D1D95A3
MKFGVVVEIRDVDEKSDVSSALTTRSIARHGGQIVMWGGAAYPDMIENFERALIIQFQGLTPHATGTKLAITRAPDRRKEKTSTSE